MTFRSSRRALLIAFGAGALSGAGQLGLGYGLGVLRLGRAFESAPADHWTAQLAWVAWFAMSSALIGAAVAYWAGTAAGDRAEPPRDRAEPADEGRAEPAGEGRRPGPAADPPDLAVRAAIATAAAFGAALVAPLSMVPAQVAPVSSADPVPAIGICAVLGAAAGLVVALAVPGPCPIRWNLAAVTGAVWLLALVSLLPSLGPSDPMPTVRLGGFDLAWFSTDARQRLALVAMPALALVAGAVAGGLARWREHTTPVVATCGAAGPAMLSLAYLIAGPGTGADRYQTTPYWAAMVATAAGLLGSALAATVRWPVISQPASQPGLDDADSPPPPDPDTPPAFRDTPPTVQAAQPFVPAARKVAGTMDSSAAAGGGTVATGATIAEALAGSAGVPASPVRAPDAAARPAGFGADRPRPTTEDFWPSTSTGATADRAGREHDSPVATARSEPGSSANADADATADVDVAQESGEAPTGWSGRSPWRRLRWPRPTTAIGDEASPEHDAAARADGTRTERTGSAAEADHSHAGPSGTTARSASTTARSTETTEASGTPADPEKTDDPSVDRPAEGGPAVSVPRPRRWRPRAGSSRKAEPAGIEPAGVDGTPTGTPRIEPDLPAEDAEYVNWVSGLRGRDRRRDDPARTGGPVRRRPTSGDRGDDR